MRKPRNRQQLEKAIIIAKTLEAKALAYYNLGLFHDNNSREVEAIPNYKKAIKLGLNQETKAEALAWLASSLYKTGNPKDGLKKLVLSRHLTTNNKLKVFLGGLEKRIKRKLD
jgi:tetratricopeptide (TPR) repeat protein